MSELEFVNSEDLVMPVGFAHGVLVPADRDLLFLAGQCGHGPDGRIESPGDLVAQFDRSLANLGSVLRAAGMGFTEIASLTIFVLDRTDYAARRQELGRVYRRHAAKHYPAMALLEVKGLYDPLALIEVMGVAARGRSKGEQPKKGRP